MQGSCLCLKNNKRFTNRVTRSVLKIRNPHFYFVSNISPKGLLQIASQLSNRLKHSNVRESADLGTEERPFNN